MNSTTVNSKEMHSSVWQLENIGLHISTLVEILITVCKQ